MKKNKIKFLLLLVLIWLCIGFSTGIGVLLVPVRIATSFLREINMDHSIEKWTIRFIMFAYVCITFCISLWITTRLKKMTSYLDRSLLIIVLISLTFGSVYLMMKPKWLGLDRGKETSLGQRFTFGPYPSKERLLKLKKENYTGVISLLHNLVVPFEPTLLADVIENASKIGIPVIHIPLLPWIGKNEESLKKLAEIAKKGTGKYYIHCYLGKDRVRIAERVIRLYYSGNEKDLNNVKGKEKYLPWIMERGFRVSLSDFGDFIPYPSKEEWLSIIGSTRYKTILSLLDPKDSSDKSWLEKEKKQVKLFNLPWVNIPLSPDRIKNADLESLSNKIKLLPTPILVHSYKTNTSRSQVFLDICQTNFFQPSMELFSTPLSNGKAISVLPGIVFGPKPLNLEWGERLKSCGIKNVIKFHKEPGAFKITGPVIGEGGLNVFNIHGEISQCIEEISKWSSQKKPVYIIESVESKKSAFLYDLFNNTIQLSSGSFLTRENNKDLDSILSYDIWKKIIIIEDSKNPGFNIPENIKTNSAIAKISWNNEYRTPDKIKEVLKNKSFPMLIITNSNRSINYINRLFKTGSIPLVPENLSKPEMIEILGANVAVSVTENGLPEISSLKQLGINDVIFYGNDKKPEVLELRKIIEKSKIRWHGYDNWASLILGNLNKGPYCLCGPWPPELIRKVKLSVIPLNSDHTFKLLLPEVKKIVSKQKEVKETAIFHWFIQFVPDVRLILMISPILFIWIWIASSITIWLKINKNWKTGYSRKTFHFLIITSASILQLTSGLKAVSLLGAYVGLWVCYATWRGRGFPFFEALARPKDEPKRGLFVILPLFTTALGGILSNLFFGKFAIIGYLVCGWGDGVGEVAGTLYGKHPYTVPGLAGIPATRSLEGSAAVGIVGSIAAFAGFITLGISPQIAIPVALTCGVIGMFVEAFSNHGLDNLTLQLAASAVAFLFIT